MPLSAAAAGLIGTGVSAAFNAASQAVTNSQNRRQAEYAYRQQQLAVERMNAFNSPGQQVLRMKSAGLNPSLAYGADGSMVGNQSDLPAYNPIPAEAPNVPDFGVRALDAARYGLELREQRNHDSLAEVEMATRSAEGYRALMAAGLDDQTRKNMAALLQPQLDELSARTAAEIADGKLKERSKDYYDSLEALNDAKVHEAASSAGLSDALARRYLALYPHEILQMDANAALSYALNEEAYSKVAGNLQALWTDREYLKLAWEHYNIDLEQLGINAGYLNVSEQELELHNKQFEHQRAIDWAEFTERSIIDANNAVQGWVMPWKGLGNYSPAHNSSMGHYGSGRRGYQPSHQIPTNDPWKKAARMKANQ